MYSHHDHRLVCRVLRFRFGRFWLIRCRTVLYSVLFSVFRRICFGLELPLMIPNHAINVTSRLSTLLQDVLDLLLECCVACPSIRTDVGVEVDAFLVFVWLPA